jgi:hypothetical protein
MVLGKKKEQLIRDKIAIWSRHQELDKFNYNFFVVYFFGNLTLIFALISALQIIKNPMNKIFASIIILLLISIVLSIVWHNFNKTNMRFVCREKMINQWYSELGVSKEELNAEFRNIL